MKLPLMIGATLFLLQAASCVAQDVFSSRGSSEWDNAPIRGTGNRCQQAERWIDGRWVTSQNGSCAGDDRNDAIDRPKGWSGINNRQTAQPDPAPQSNGYRGLSDEQARNLQARNQTINDRPDVRFFNSMAPSKGVPKYQAGPPNSNVKGRGGFGRWKNQAGPRRSGPSNSNVKGRGGFGRWRNQGRPRRSGQ